MDIKIVCHPSGDWEGLYLDNTLFDEGHSIYTECFIDAITKYIKDNGNITSIEYDTRDLGNEGFDVDFSFPLKYEDINNENSNNTK